MMFNYYIDIEKKNNNIHIQHTTDIISYRLFISLVEVHGDSPTDRLYI